MGIRESVNKYPARAAGTVLVCISVLLISAMHSSRSSRLRPVFPDKSFFSTDDGTTWFADSASNIPPYEHDGKQAVQAMVFSCNGGRDKWVQYLQKYTDEAKAGVLAIQSGQDLPHGAPGPLTGVMVKAPGSAQWVPQSSPPARQIMTPNCPDGSSGPAILVVP